MQFALFIFFVLIRYTYLKLSNKLFTKLEFYSPNFMISIGFKTDKLWNLSRSPGTCGYFDSNANVRQVLCSGFKLLPAFTDLKKKTNKKPTVLKLFDFDRKRDLTETPYKACREFPNVRKGIWQIVILLMCISD